jgi:hypothetical protein
VEIDALLTEYIVYKNTKFLFKDRLCGLVVRVSGYRSRGPGFDSEKYEVWNGAHSAS